MLGAPQGRMLLHTPFSRVSDNTLPLPTWARAPLYLHEGSKAHLAYATGSAEQLPEILISPFAPSIWPHLWRIEAQLTDRQGTLAKLFGILYEKDVKVLHCETSIADPNDYHTVSIIINCRDYRSDRDLDASQRQKFARVELLELYGWILVTLIDDLKFFDNTKPRLKVRRIHSYHIASKRLYSEAAGQKALLPARNTKVKRGGVKIPKQTLQVIRRSLGLKKSEGLYAQAMSDSKDRMIRVLLFPEGRSLSHFRITFSDQRISPAEILSLAAQDFDVVRYQLHLSSVQQKGRRQMDLVLRIPDDPYATTRQMEARLEQRIASLVGRGAVLTTGALYENRKKEHE